MTPEERLKRKNEFDGNLAEGVRRFNLITGRDVHLERRVQKKNHHINPATGLLREELSALRCCPVCSADEGRQIFVKKGFRHLKCDSCGMVYVNPVLREERLHSLYLDEYSWSQILCNQVQISMDRKKYKYGLDLINKYILKKGRLIDIGCGPGLFLQVARERNWQVQGVEFNKLCLQHLKELKISVIDIPLEQAELPPNSYQCVTLWDVLEHIINPRYFLRTIHRILVPGGVLLVLIPNIESLVSRILHDKSATFSGDSHVNFFNASTLAQLLEQVGFMMQECETILTELGTINNYLNFEDPYFGEGSTVLDFLTPEFIHERMLGSRILALAKAHKE